MTSNVLYVIANLDAIQNVAIASAIIQSVWKCHGGKSCSNQPSEDCEDDLKQEQELNLKYTVCCICNIIWTILQIGYKGCIDELSCLPTRQLWRQSTSSCHEGVTLSCLSHRATTLCRQSLGVEPDISFTTDGSSFRARPRAFQLSFSAFIVSTTSRSEELSVRDMLKLIVIDLMK